jgi:hypothetical protein
MFAPSKAFALLLVLALAASCGARRREHAADLEAWLSETDGNTVAFTDTYTGFSPGAGDWRTYGLVGREPAEPGDYPVLVYTVGTFGSYTTEYALALIQQAAEAGFVAASVEYNNWLRFSCSDLSAKAEGIYDEEAADSAVAVLCARDRAACEKGIVSAGHSQGSWMAELAGDFAPDLRAALALGSGTDARSWGGDHSACLAGDRVLPDDQLRVVNGESDHVWSWTHAGMIDQLNVLTGRSCSHTTTDCLAADGSGWLLAPDAEVTDGEADHCYMGIDGCVPVDPVWLESDAGWALPAGLDFLAARVDP